MQYFYLLNNKDIYGVDGRFFGPNLSVCDCVDYFKHLGVQEGILTDINIGGLNGCYQYTNDSLIYKGSSCGISICNLIENSDWGANYCRCDYGTPYVSLYIEILNQNLLSNCQTIEFQAQSYAESLYGSCSNSLPSINWNVPVRTLQKLSTQTNPSACAYPYTRSISIISLGGSSTQVCYFVRIRKNCGNGFYSPWSQAKLLTVPVGPYPNPLGPSCPEPLICTQTIY